MAGTFDRQGSLTDKLSDTISADVPVGIVVTIPTPTITQVSTGPLVPDPVGVVATIPLPTITATSGPTATAVGVVVTIPTVFVSTVEDTPATPAAGAALPITARDRSQFYRSTSVGLVLPLGVGRGGLLGLAASEGWEKVSSQFILNGTTEGHTAAMASVASAWAAHKDSAAAVLLNAIDANLNTAGYRDKNGDEL